MSFDYAPLAALSLSLLTQFGRDVTHRVTTIGTYSPSTGANAQTYSDTTRKGALFDFGAGKTTERGTLIQVGDKQLLLDAAATVAMQDRFIVGSVEYALVSIGEINPAGTLVLYDLHVRVA